jgi:hypothetical protein
MAASALPLFVNWSAVEKSRHHRAVRGMPASTGAARCPSNETLSRYIAIHGFFSIRHFHP